MKDPFVPIWVVLILSSVFWYGFLVFYVGIKAGRDIVEMIAALKRDHAKSDPR